ncbi:MAG TPA: nuclear transport factor 2 family protein [Steroidobacteraceae bacterium]
MMRPASKEALVKEAYRAFNARDADAALATLHEDVEWDNGEGQMLVGRPAVRDHWRQQWSAADPKIELVTLSDGLGNPTARIHLMIHVDGQLKQNDLENNFTFADGRIRSMRIRPVA